MRKLRMTSVIAASLLTATVVFTGCGGGGSSTAGMATSTSSSTSSTSSASTTSSSTSSTSSASSECLPGQDCGGAASSTAPTIKTVTVSDGWVLGATVKCKNQDGSDVAVGASATPAGTYEIDITGKTCPVLCAKEGYIDANGDGQITSGEAKIPQLGAPGSFDNITPYSTFLAHGVSVADLEAATGLSAASYNNFDQAVPTANDAEYAKQAVLLSAAIAYIQSGATTTSTSSTSSNDNSSTTSTSSTGTTEGVLPSGPTVREVLPGGPGAVTTPVASSEENTQSSAPATEALTYATLIERMKNGESIDQIIPELAGLVSALEGVTADEYQQDPGVFDKKAAPYIATVTGKCAEEICVAPAATETSGTAGECLPGQTCSTASETNTTSTSSEGTTSSEAVECLPGQPCGEETSSSEATSSVSESSVPSSVSSSVSSTATSTDTVLPSGPGA